MGKNQSASNLTNIIRQDASGNITFLSGSKTLAVMSNTGQVSGSVPALSASYAATSSYATNFNVSGTITATTLVVQTITSSVSLITGSTQFGSTLANTHVFSGSVTMNPGGLFVSSSGNVGIGTSNPSTKFDLSGSIGNFQIAASGAEIFFTRNENNDILATGGSSSGLSIGAQSYVRFYSGTGYTERMRITSTGLVRINTTSTLGGGYLGINGDIEFGGTAGGNYRITNYQAGFLAFGTDNTERMRITSGGSVGIGTSSPSQRFSVVENSEVWNSSFKNSNGTESVDVYLAYGSGHGIAIDSSENDSKYIFKAMAGTGGGGGKGSVPILYAQCDGKVGIGTSSPVYKLEVIGTIRAEGGSGINVFSGGGTGPLQIDYPGTLGGRLNLDNSGNMTIRGSLTQNASDRRLKNNIQNIPDALNKINQINGITFDWDTEIYDTGRTSDIGVIAQEVQEVLPGAVALAPFDTDHVNGGSRTGENYLTVYYEKLIPLLIEGIKELNTKLDAANAEIEALKNK